MSLAATDVPPRPVVNGWIVGPWFDSLILTGSAAVVLLGWLGVQYAVDATLIIAMVAVLSNGPHLTATWTRAYLDARERNERPVAYLVVPVAIAMGVVALGTSGRWGTRMLMSIVLVWAVWHFCAQCYGLLRIYQKKSGEAPRLAHRLEAWLIFAAGATGLLWRLHYGPTRVFGYRVLLPDVPYPLVALAMGVVCILGLGIAIDRVPASVPLGGRRLVFIASCIVGLWVPFLFIEHGSAAFASAAGWHGLQYLGVVWLFNRRKFAGKPLPDGARLVAWVSQPGRWWAFIGLLWALAVGVYGVVFVTSAALGSAFGKTAALTWMSLTLGHYWLDGLIWKMRRPAVASNLT